MKYNTINKNNLIKSRYVSSNYLTKPVSFTTSSDGKSVPRRTGHSMVTCTCKSSLEQMSPWWNCWLGVTCSTTEQWRLHEWPRHRTGQKAQRTVMRKLFGTLWGPNEGDTFAHTQNLFSILKERARISVAWWVVRDPCEHAAYNPLSDWHSQTLVSDDRLTWLANAQLRTALTRGARPFSSLQENWQRKEYEREGDIYQNSDYELIF